MDCTLGPWNPKFPYFEPFTRRMQSYKHWRLHPFVGDYVLALAGFFHLEHDSDTVQCYYCGLTINGFIPTDNPLDEHFKHRSRCRHIQLIGVAPENSAGFDTI